MFKKIIITILVLLLLSGASYFLYQKYSPVVINSQNQDIVEIVFSENITSFSPYTLEETNNQRLRLIYEPLVQVDADLSIRPSLASSYGQLDPLTWEFTLNPQAKFHNQQAVTSEVIAKNFEKFKSIPTLNGLISNIAEFKVVDPTTFLISTKTVDTSFLNKISLLLITPDIELSDLLKDPIGTGPYTVTKIQKNKLSLTANSNYYGRKPLHPKLLLTAISNPFERIRYANSNDRVAMFSNVPPGFVDQVSKDFNLNRYPTNSVNFFLFNFNRPTFAALSLRTFMNQVLSNNLILKATDDLGKPTMQYVSQGVFGFNPDISIPKLSSEEVIANVKSKNLAGLEFKIALPEGFDTFRQILILELNKFGLLPEIELVPVDELLSEETIKNFDLIYYGWKSDYGNSISFFENFALPVSGLNSLGYQNTEVTSLINKVYTVQTADEKLNLLRNAMQIIAVKNPIGIPLFETETIYGIHKEYQYTPRLDGFIDPNNLSLTSK